MLFNHLIDLLKQSEANLIDYQIKNNSNIINGASIEKAESEELTFLEKENHLINSLNITNASAILIPNKQVLKEKANSKNISWASFDFPKLAFAEALNYLTPESKPYPEIHKSAFIGENVLIDDHVYIGPNVCIGDNCSIGEGTIIHAGVVIYKDVEIGKDNEFHSNCVLQRKTKVGNNCVIHSNAVIGSEGFGFIPTKKGWVKMPQTGLVVIEDNVEIGCSTNVDRPSVGETRIGEGTKIDNLVQIGHGVIIGKSCAMASQVGIAGGAILGDNVILAGQVGVTNRVKVGDRVVASSKCGIHTDIEPGQIISGFPAIPNRLWLKCSANFKKLPEIAKSLSKLKK
tara:strand:- start:19182 stop:20213 length:1032 start_codon:yes stop_codon:yes gene_type:complete